MENQTVWVVFTEDFGADTVHGVFSTKGLANSFATHIEKAYPCRTYIMDWEVDKDYSRPVVWQKPT